MASLNTYNQNNQGFSLLEIIVVVAVIIVILSFGMLVDWNVFKKDTFKAEQATIVAALSKARSRAMNNMFDTAYGVCYIAPNYIIFQDNTCTAGESISANTNIASNPSTVFPPVVFLSAALLLGVYLPDFMRATINGAALLLGGKAL